MPDAPDLPRPAVRALTWLALVALVALGGSLASCSRLASTPSGADPAATGPAGGVSGTLITEPDQGYTPIDALITSAKTSVDMTMYELTDTTAEQALAQDAGRGITVRVVLDQNLERTHNQPAYDYLAQHGVKVVWAPSRYSATHQKTITVDGTTAAILTGNLTSQYYATSRDFAVLDTDPHDVAAIEQVFTADVTGQPVTPSDGDDLVWSPTDSENQLLDLINTATTTLQVENEEMSSSRIVTALVAAARRGVNVQVTMTRQSDWTRNFTKLAAAGVHVATYAASASLYIHAKVIEADYGTTTARVFLGSENFSTASLTRNRELGVVLRGQPILAAVHTTLGSDYTAATPWASG